MAELRPGVCASESRHASPNRGKIAFARWLALGHLLIGAAFLAACNHESKLVKPLQEQVDALQLQLDARDRELAARDTEIARLGRELANRPALAKITVDDLFTVEKIKLASRTGGANFDGKPGDDGVIVYLQPLDAAGDVIKAAGQVTVQLTDLASGGAPRAVATYTYDDPAQIRQSWYGGMLTNHFTFRCAFPDAAGAAWPREVNIRVTFLDWLTGREHVTSTSVPIQPPVSPPPA